MRLAPLDPRAMGVTARVLAAVMGRVTRGEPPRVFTTLARHPRLLRSWARFAGTLLLRSELPRADVELVVLRTACNCSCRYEWVQHVALAERRGVRRAAIDAVAGWAEWDGWTPRQRLLLQATDELHARRTITDATWARLAAALRDRELIELCMLVGQYEMLAMTLNSLGVEPEPTPLARLAGPAAGVSDRLRRSLAESRRAGA